MSVHAWMASKRGSHKKNNNTLAPTASTTRTTTTIQKRKAGLESGLQALQTCWPSVSGQLHKQQNVWIRCIGSRIYHSLNRYEIYPIHFDNIRPDTKEETKHLPRSCQENESMNGALLILYTQIVQQWPPEWGFQLTGLDETETVDHDKKFSFILEHLLCPHNREYTFAILKGDFSNPYRPQSVTSLLHCLTHQRLAHLQYLRLYEFIQHLHSNAYLITSWDAMASHLLWDYISQQWRLVEWSMIWQVTNDDETENNVQELQKMMNTRVWKLPFCVHEFTLEELVSSSFTNVNVHKLKLFVQSMNWMTLEWIFLYKKPHPLHITHAESMTHVEFQRFSNIVTNIFKRDGQLSNECRTILNQLQIQLKDTQVFDIQNLVPLRQSFSSLDLTAEINPRKPLWIHVGDVTGNGGDKNWTQSERMSDHTWKTKQVLAPPSPLSGSNQIWRGVMKLHLSILSPSNTQHPTKGWLTIEPVLPLFGFLIQFSHWIPTKQVQLTYVIHQMGYFYHVYLAAVHSEPTVIYILWCFETNEVNFSQLLQILSSQSINIINVFTPFSPSTGPTTTTTTSNNNNAIVATIEQLVQGFLNWMLRSDQHEERLYIL